MCHNASITSPEAVFISKVKSFPDKNGGSVPVYDAVIGSEVFSTIQADQELEVQQQVGVKIIKHLNTETGEGLEEVFSTPVTKGGYKGEKVTEISITVDTVADSGNSSSSTTSSSSAGKAPDINASGSFISPVPGVVIKTKSPDSQLKIFINLCTHESIPNAEKPVLFTGPSRPFKKIGEEDAMLYDAVVYPTTLNAITSMKAGAARESKLREVTTKLKYVTGIVYVIGVILYNYMHSSTPIFMY